MKTYAIFGLFILLVLSSCSTTQWADGSYYQDDIYYRPKSDPMVVADKYAPVTSEKQLQKENTKAVNQMKSDYEQSSLADNRDFSQIQSDYLGLLANDSVAEVDSLMYYNEETGYWVNGFNGSNWDQDYAERMIRFHGPFNGIPYWSPLYNDMVYFNDYNWNVYVDGNYAYAFPTWSNPWYNSHYNYGYRNPWRFSFSMGYGWGYPYYGHYGYYDSFYSPYRSPYYGYYGHNYYSPYYYGGYSGGSNYTNIKGRNASTQTRVYQPRNMNTYSTRTRINTTTGSRSGTMSTRSGSHLNNSRLKSTPTLRSYETQTTRVNYNNKNQKVVTDKASGKTYTRTANPQSPQKNTGTVRTKSAQANSGSNTVRTTRRTYTPSYSNSNRSTRSSYNRSSTYSRPSRSSSSNRSYSGSTNRSSSSRSSYSGSSSRSSYSPSRSSGSSSRSSYTPSRSSSSRSSSSSYSGSSSSSSSRSSGTSRSSGARRSR